MAELYHGSGMIVEKPEIRITKYTKDFGWGFYCTGSYKQAERWAKRHRRDEEVPTVNRYEYKENGSLKIKRFDEMTEEWLDLIAKCRAGGTHEFDIVEGPMADDEVWSEVENFLRGEISRTAFWELARFKHPTSQIVFCTDASLQCLRYRGNDRV